MITTKGPLPRTALSNAAAELPMVADDARKSKHWLFLNRRARERRVHRSSSSRTVADLAAAAAAAAIAVIIATIIVEAAATAKACGAGVKCGAHLGEAGTTQCRRVCVCLVLQAMEWAIGKRVGHDELFVKSARPYQD